MVKYCCDNFKQAVEENVISNTDHDWFSENELDGWYLLYKEPNWVDEYDYYKVGEPIKYCPWCMTPIIYDDNIKL